MNETITKICTKCGVEKELSEFYNSKTKKDGKSSKCKECTTKDNRARDFYTKNTYEENEEITYQHESKKSLREAINRDEEKYSSEHNNKIEFYPPQHYWDIAKEYIIKKDAELRKEGIYYIDKQLAMKYIKFGSIIKHTAGKTANVNFQFQQWQIEMIVDVFGTKYIDGEFKGLRRYQKVLLFIPKKNGKSEVAGLLHILVFFLDKQLSKEQYSIASDLEQALIIHNVVVTMINNIEELKEQIEKITIQPPAVQKSVGAYRDVFRSLARPSGDTKDGKKVTFFTSDEGHAQPTKELYQLMTNGLASNDEPLEIHLSTAGYNKEGYFYRDIYSYAKKVKNGVIKDDRFYSVMFEIDDEELKELEDKDPNYWKDPKIWARVNPNIGISPTYSFMHGKISEAEQSEESLVAFKTKHLNQWLDKADTWIKHSVWTKNQSPIDEEALRGKLCYGGLDLASTTDIASLVLIFPKEDGGYDILTRFWIPKDQMRERVRRDRVPYYDWVKEGLILTTEGNVIDYDFIERDIKELCEKFNVKSIAYDRWNASSLVTNLTNDDVVELIPFGQGYSSMSAPTKQIDVLALQGRLNHGDNPVLNWMCSNVVLKRDPADGIKIDKSKSIEKVDGMVSLAMALGIALIDKKEEDTNVYEHRGMRSL